MTKSYIVFRMMYNVHPHLSPPPSRGRKQKKN